MPINNSARIIRININDVALHNGSPTARGKNVFTDVMY